jgi:hypothetical protein
MASLARYREARAQEFMRALQCFMYEFWDLETYQLETVVPDKAAVEGLIGGWCVMLPEDSRICHIRWCAPPACSCWSLCTFLCLMACSSFHRPQPEPPMCSVCMTGLDTPAVDVS